jgi:hypothetical protein
VDIRTGRDAERYLARKQELEAAEAQRHADALEADKAQPASFLDRFLEAAMWAVSPEFALSWVLFADHSNSQGKEETPLPVEEQLAKEFPPAKGPALKAETDFHNASREASKGLYVMSPEPLFDVETGERLDAERTATIKKLS